MFTFPSINLLRSQRFYLCLFTFLSHFYASNLILVHLKCHTKYSYWHFISKTHNNKLWTPWIEDSSIERYTLFKKLKQENPQKANGLCHTSTFNFHFPVQRNAAEKNPCAPNVMKLHSDGMWKFVYFFPFWEEA